MAVVLNGFVDCFSCREGSFFWTREFSGGQSSLFLLWLLARGWVSLGIEFLSFLDLLLGLSVSSVLGIHQFFLELLLLHLQVLGFLLLLGLGDGGNFGSVGLRFLRSVFGILLLLHQCFLFFLKSHLVLCLEGDLSVLALL